MNILFLIMGDIFQWQIYQVLDIKYLRSNKIKEVESGLGNIFYLHLVQSQVYL
ncbi:hypothetical protein ACX55_1483 [Francisella tularensis subsp. tularensis]|nr:hypothetical protein CH65_935 [Francisella tularensis subsp. tularensis]AKU74045.1 hypothetical protein ACX55_1483 [Francisella tularensis subsp. tularensis]KFJ65003.1 hypothetical protein DR81_423 [Francisella tularensis]